MKHNWKKSTLAFLLTLLMLMLLAGMGLPAYAYDGDPYTALIATVDDSYESLAAKAVSFNGYDWNIIADESTAVDAGTLTLIAKEPIDNKPYNERNDGNFYSKSTVKSYLDSLTAEGGAFADVADAIVTIPSITTTFKQKGVSYTDTVTNVKLYLPSKDEVYSWRYKPIISCKEYDGNNTSTWVRWWTRTPGEGGTGSTYYAFNRYGGMITESSGSVTYEYGVRPALRLDLSKVTYDTTSRRFVVAPLEYSVTLSGGANATADPATGTSQTGLTGAMTTVTYTANSGYMFPETSDYYTTTSGVTVARTSNTKVTVSGTPTANVTITVPDAVVDDTGAPVPYLAWDYTNKTMVEKTGDEACTDYIEVTDSTTTWGEPNGVTWYVVKKNVTISSRITVSGNVSLILCDGATLNANQGIEVANNNGLTIYAQSTNSDMGELNAIGVDSNKSAGIGGHYESGKTIKGGTVTINGGKVNAKGGELASGIGGGYYGAGGTVTINGGIVTATGGAGASVGGAGIGGGQYGSGGTVIINDGTVTAIGLKGGAGIGGGYAQTGGTVTINGGTITAIGNDGGSGIGGGNGRNTSSTDNGTVILGSGVRIYAGADAEHTQDVTTSFAESHTQPYVRTEGGAVESYTVTVESTEHGTVTSDKQTAAEGETITLTVAPGTGYGLTQITAVWGDSQTALTLTKDSANENKYTFTMPAGNVTVNAKFSKPTITGADLALNGSLDFRFYVDIPAGIDTTGANMTFSIGGGSGRTSQNIPLTSAGTSTDTATKGQRIFSFPVYAIEMAQDVTAVFHYQAGGEDKTAKLTTSIEKYLDKVEELNKDPNYSEKLAELITATRNYGHYMQPYLAGLHGFTIGTDYTAMPAGSEITALESLKGFERTWNPSDSLPTGYDNSVLNAVGYYDTFSESTTLNVLVNLKTSPTKVTATVDGKETTVENPDDNIYRIQISNIAANNLGATYRVVFSADGNPFCDMNVSALTYVGTVLPKAAERNKTGEAEALTAFYDYYVAANAYAGN